MHSEALIEIITGCIAGTYVLYLGIATLEEGKAIYKEAKNNFAQLDEMHLQNIPKPSRKDAYKTAFKLALLVGNPQQGYNILNKSSNGKIADELIKQNTEKLAWGDNYKLIPKKFQ